MWGSLRGGKTRVRKKRTELRVHAAVDQLQLEGNRPRELVGEIRRHEPQPDGPNGRELVLRDPNLPLVELFGVDHGSGPAPGRGNGDFLVAGGRDARSTDDDAEDDVCRSILSLSRKGGGA